MDDAKSPRRSLVRLPNSKQPTRPRDWNYGELCIETSRIGRDVELDPLPREHSQILAKVLTALRAEGVTRAEFAGELHRFQDDPDALMFGLTLSAVDGACSPDRASPRQQTNL